MGDAEEAKRRQSERLAIKYAQTSELKNRLINELDGKAGLAGVMRQLELKELAKARRGADKKPLLLTQGTWQQEQKKAADRREAERNARRAAAAAAKKSSRPKAAQPQPRRAKAMTVPTRRTRKHTPRPARRRRESGPTQCTCEPPVKSKWAWCCSSAVQEKCEFCQRNKPEKRTRGEKKK